MLLHANALNHLSYDLSNESHYKSIQSIQGADTDGIRVSMGHGTQYTERHVACCAQPDSFIQSHVGPVGRSVVAAFQCECVCVAACE